MYSHLLCETERKTFAIFKPSGNGALTLELGVERLSCIFYILMCVYDAWSVIHTHMVQILCNIFLRGSYSSRSSSILKQNMTVVVLACKPDTVFGWVSDILWIGRFWLIEVFTKFWAQLKFTVLQILVFSRKFGLVFLVVMGIVALPAFALSKRDFYALPLNCFSLPWIPLIATIPS